MKSKPLRSILGFYSAEGEPEEAYQAVRDARRGRVLLFKPDRPSKPGQSSIERYSSLRLEGEFLVAVEASPADVEPIVKRLQSAGSPAVFVLREDLADLPDLCSDKPIDVSGPIPRNILARLRENEAALDLSRRDLM